MAAEPAIKDAVVSDAGRLRMQTESRAAMQAGWLDECDVLGLACLLQEHVCEGEAGPTGQAKADQLAVVLAQLIDYVHTRICTCTGVSI